MDIFQQAIGEGFRNAALEKELKKGLKPTPTAVRKNPLPCIRDAHEHYHNFFEFGDAESFAKGLERLRL